MTCPAEDAGLERIFKVLAEEGFDSTGEAFALLLLAYRQAGMK